MSSIVLEKPPWVFQKLEINACAIFDTADMDCQWSIYYHKPSVI